MLKKPQRPLGLAIVRWLGSLQVAVVALSAFASVLAVGTVVESWYSDKVAKDLVYRTWWFNGLLFVLGVNIFFAAAKKWPWKKHQTGFVITHVGLILLVLGGLFTGLGGVDTTMALVDNPAAEQKMGIPQHSQLVADREKAAIRVRMPGGGREVRSYAAMSFGQLPWKSDEYLQPKLHPLLAILDFLDHPWPRSWSADLDDDARLEILNFYPHARREPFRPAGKDDSEGVIAVKVMLSATSIPMMREGMPLWVSTSPRSSFEVLPSGTAMVQMLNECAADMVDEFRHPPADAGEQGQLVLRVGGAVHRLDVAKLVGKDTTSLGDSGWKVRITRYVAGSTPDDPVPSNPKLDFELTSPGAGQATEFGVLGRMPGKLFPQGVDLPPGLRDVAAWYHAPDPRFGQKFNAVLQFALTPDHTLYYRSYSTGKGAFALDREGLANKGESNNIWAEAAGWKFHVDEFLTNAIPDTGFIPVDLRAGLEDQEAQPALRCRLTVKNETREFFVGRTPEKLTTVTLGGRDYGVGFNDSTLDLGFDVKLVRAETLTDPGASSKAMYTSWVTITDRNAREPEQDFMVTMNEPLKYRGYKFYQSGLGDAQTISASLKPANYSVFTVSVDPGIWLKHLGWVSLGIGIVCMFYMKAYLFKPRGKQAA